MVKNDDDSLSCGYLKTFDNNVLLEKRTKTSEFSSENAEFKMNKLHNNL